MVQTSSRRISLGNSRGIVRAQCSVSFVDLVEADAYLDELVILTHQIEGLIKPDRLLLKHFIATVKPYLKEGDASFLEAPREDWLEAFPIETLNRWLKLMPEHGTFRSLCVSQEISPSVQVC